MSKEWFIKEGGQVCFKSDNAELNGWDTQSLVNCLNGKEIKIANLESKLADMTKKYEFASLPMGGLVDMARNLEQQLKESEHRNEQLIDALNGEVFINYKLPMENAQLKQQLDEKDKEIEQLKKFDDLNKTFFNLFRIAVKEPDKVDDLFNTIKTIQEKQDQDKISFCIEQLEKVRTQFLTNYSWYEETHRVCEKTDNFVIWLDNQIKQLKEKK